MHTTAKRTQIYLPADLYQEVLRYANAEGLSLAAVIRWALQRSLPHVHTPSAWTYERDPIWKLVGAAKSREGDLSTCHDHYLYGKPKAACS